jgi:hypothetical protein
MSEQIVIKTRVATDQLRKISAEVVGVTESPTAAELAKQVADVCGKIISAVGVILDKSALGAAELAKAQGENDTAATTLRSVGITEDRAPEIFSAAGAALEAQSRATISAQPVEGTLADIRGLATSMKDAHEMAAVTLEGENGVAETAGQIQTAADNGADGGMRYAEGLESRG